MSLMERWTRRSMSTAHVASVLGCLVSAVVAIVPLVSCGGHGVALDSAPGEGRPAARGEGLPELSKLSQPSRQLSMAGPGYYAIPPLDAMQWNNAVPGPGGSLIISGGSSMGFAVYGVYGFDGDNGPTSARVTSASVTGSYYVAFSDYLGGKWTISGPFNASATAEIRLPDGQGVDMYTSATAFTSPAHATYLAVIVEQGSTLQLDQLALGVHGGRNGPKMPYAGGYGPKNRFYIRIVPVKSEFAPDYAGFLIERAPQFSGDYVPLFTQPIRVRYYNDSSAETGVRYRYRVAAVDVSGNVSPWFTFTAGPREGALSAPFVRLKAPRGPLRGKSTVTFDMSDSLDPEGIGITKYSLTLSGQLPASYSGANPTVSMTLQPGCYLVVASVETSDSRDDSLIRPLKVYPAWEDTPVVVAGVQQGVGVPRIRPVSLGRFSSTGRLLAVGSDFVSGGLLGWYEPLPLVMNWTPRFMPQIAPLLGGISEPVELQGALYVAVSDGGPINVLQCQTGAMASLGLFWSAFDGSPVALASDGVSQLWTVYAEENAGQYRLVVQEIHGDGRTTNAQLNIGTPYDVDAVYNSDVQAVDIILSADIGVEWLRWDPVLRTVSKSAILNGANASAVDIEINPLSGRPAVMFAMGTDHYYSELTAGGLWTVQEQIDNSQVNRSPGDMEFGADGAPCCYFALNAGQAHLYQRNAPGVWTVRNTPPAPTNSGFDVDMINLPGSEDFVVADTDVSGNVHLLTLESGGACPEKWQLKSSEGLGRWLSGAAGTLDQTANGPEELHASFGTINPFPTTHHYTSTNQGLTWTPRNDIGLKQTSLAASGKGFVYLTGSSGTDNFLDLWSPATNSFAGLKSYPADPANAPTVYGDLGDDYGEWFTYDQAATTLHFDEYDGSTPAFTTASTPEQTPIWSGTQAILGYSFGMLCLAGGTQIDDALVYYCDPYHGEMNLIQQPGIGAGLRLFSHPLVELHQLASARYLYNYGADEGALGQTAIWATAMFYTSGEYGQALRFDLVDNGNNRYAQLPLPSLESLLYMRLDSEPRRTVAAFQACGTTAVALVASIDGKDAYFAWSDYGNWEELPLPHGLQFMSLPQLFMGRDGAWYMLYHNWSTDQIMCIRTTP